ncbi:MAG: hypothetical protein R3E89_11945 [Thiolinea sp.]
MQTWLYNDADAGAYKQQVLLGNLAVGKVTPESVFAPLTAEPWGYRRKARLEYVMCARRTAPWSVFVSGTALSGRHAAL